MATSNETSAPITIEQMIASARAESDRHTNELRQLRVAKVSLAKQIADVLVEFNEANRILKALTPREPKVRTSKSKNETNG